MKLNLKNLAKEIIVATDSTQELEFQLENYLFDKDDAVANQMYLYIFDISADPYDQSLEISMVVEKEWDINLFNERKVTKEFIDAVLASGCSQFWINIYYSEHKDDKFKIAEIYCSPRGSNMKYPYKPFTCCGKGCCNET